MNKGNSELEHLKKKEQVSGQLYFLSRASQRRHHALFGLATEDGRNLIVKFNNRWKSALFRNLWNYVLIEGVVDYCDGSVQINSLKLDDHGIGILDSCPPTPEEDRHLGFDIAYLGRRLTNGLGIKPEPA